MEQNRVTTPKGRAAFSSFVAILSAIAFYAAARGTAYAACNGTMCSVICTILNGTVYNGLAQAAATISIVMAGAAAALGRVSWNLAFTAAFGITILFGAATFVSYFNIGDPC
jgi:type IV secretory pathway VirB2 component (pilin)